MIFKCDSKFESIVFSYIGKNYPTCLYLFLDLKKYGFDSDTVSVFIQQNDNNINAVLLQYYSCLHVYSSNNDFDSHEIGNFIAQNKYIMIYCSTETAHKIYKNLPAKIRKSATITEGWVAQIENIDKSPSGLAVLAQNEDFDQIAKLIYEDDDIGRAYRFEELAKQLKERNEEGYARNIVIKKDSLVVAHACTNAELVNVSVVAELLVRKEYRRKGYATEIWRDICKRLLNEGKEVYSFYYSEESRKLHKKVGFFEICKWSKIVFNHND